MKEIANSALYERLDHEIRETLLDFVRCGRALKEMRDSQAYLAKYTTFEEYVKATEGMSISEARRVITDAIVVDCLDPEGRQIGTPRTRSQVRALSHAAVFIERKDVQDNPNSKTGKTVRVQPTEVKNAKQVQKIWSKVQKEHEKKVAKAEKDGTKAPKLTSSFIIDCLPAGVQPQHIVKRKNCNTSTIIIDATGKVAKAVESHNLTAEGRLEHIAKKENWTDGQWAQVNDAITELQDISRQLREAFDRVV